MTDYQKYIDALRKCAKEHDNDKTSTGHIIVSDLCRDTANLLEELSSSEILTDLTDKNNLEVDPVDRRKLLKIYEDRFIELQKRKHLKDNKGAEDKQLGVNYCINVLKEMPQAIPQQRCKYCNHWKDSDGKYRRGCDAESQCPINTHAVYCGEGYCYMFSPKTESKKYDQTKKKGV